MPLSPDALAERLETWPVARLASVGNDRRAHQVPIVFAMSGGRLWSPVDGKPKRGGTLTRVRNLLDEPNASLLLDEYQADWTRLWWIRIEATAEIIRPSRSMAPRHETDQELEIEAAIAALEAKYPQYADVPLLPEPATLIAFRPTKIVSWTAST